MRVSALLLTLILSSPCWGLELTPALETLRFLNQRPQALPPNQCLETGEPPSIPDSLLENCARTLCGPPISVPSGRLDDRNFNTYVQPGVMLRFKEVEKELSDLIKNHIAGTNAFIKKVREGLVNGKLDLHFENWSNYDFSEAAGNLFDAHFSIHIDTSKPLLTRLTLTASPPEGSTEAFKSALNSYLLEQKTLLQTSALQGLQFGLYTQEEGAQILQESYAAFSKVFTEAKTTTPDALSGNEKTLAKLARVAAAPKPSLSEIKDSLTSIEGLSGILNPNGSMTSNMRCLQEVCRSGVQAQLRNLDVKKLLLELEAANSAPDLLKNQLTYCRSSFAKRGIKASDTATLMKHWPDLKRRILSNVAKSYSPHSKKNLNSYLEESLHLTFSNDLESTLDEHIAEIRSSHGSRTTPAEVVTQEMALIRKLKEYDPYGIGPDPFESFGPCDSGLADVTDDSFATKADLAGEEAEGIDLTKDNIKVSPFSCVHHTYGKKILAHELGHAISAAFKDGRLSRTSALEFQKLRDCSKENHLSAVMIQGEVTHLGDGQWTEEDTADLVAHLTYPEKKDSLFSCVLLHTSDDNRNYLNLGFDIGPDSHSSPLQRVLVEAVNKGRVLSKSCAQLIKKAPTGKLKKCI